ncbi:MAG: hypothetical protein RR555_05215 [Bacteroidales bacterium]
MKALNYKSILKGYFVFSLYMTTIVFLFVFMWICLIATIRYEGSKLEENSALLDNLFSMQNSASARMDTLYNYLTLINFNRNINNKIILSIVNTKTSLFLNDFSKMDEKDIFLYRNLAVSINKILQTKDSIRIGAIQNDLIKNDLQRCITADKYAVQKRSREMTKQMKL